MVLALNTGNWIAVGAAALLLVIALAAFVAYTRGGHRQAGRGDALRRAAKRAGKDAKVCPSCASELPLDERDCRHCGFRFA